MVINKAPQRIYMDTLRVRAIGEEPNDNIIKQYKEYMKQIFPCYGIKCIGIPRVKKGMHPISASLVRKYLSKGEIDKVKELVPVTTYEYLKNKED